MFGRKVFALSLILILCLGTGTALALDENPPSEHLLQMTARANDLVVKLSEQAQRVGDTIVTAYNNGHIPYQVADNTLQVLCITLKHTTDAVLAPVIAQCQRENVSWRCEYTPVAIGWRTVMIDPIIVPGNSD